MSITNNPFWDFNNGREIMISDVSYIFYNSKEEKAVMCCDWEGFNMLEIEGFDLSSTDEEEYEYNELQIVVRFRLFLKSIGLD